MAMTQWYTSNLEGDALTLGLMLFGVLIVNISMVLA